jgi:hypothetical protein
MNMNDEFKDRDSFAHWFIIAALSDTKITENLRSEPKIVTMQINGEDVNPTKAILRLEQEFDRNVKLRAKELFEQYKDEIFEPLGTKVEEMTKSLDSLINEKLIPYE